MGEHDPLSVKDVEDRPSGQVLLASVHQPSGTGGNCATLGQTLKPVNPTTTSTPKSRATPAACFCLRRPLAHALRVADAPGSVFRQRPTPDGWAHDGPVADVDLVLADNLSGQVVRGREDLQVRQSRTPDGNAGRRRLRRRARRRRGPPDAATSSPAKAHPAASRAPSSKGRPAP